MAINLIIANDSVAERTCSIINGLDRSKRYVVTIREPSRSLLQNDKLHAMLGDISKQVEWGGMKLSVVVWKRLCTAAMLRENGESPLLLPGIDGHGVDIIYEKTSRMGTKMMADLIEWVYSFGASKNVVWSERIDDGF